MPEIVLCYPISDFSCCCNSLLANLARSWEFYFYFRAFRLSYLISIFTWDCALYRRCVGIFFIFVSVKMSRLVSDFIVLCADTPHVRSKQSMSLMSPNASVTVGGTNELWHLHRYLFDEFISQYGPLLDARRVAMKPVGLILTVEVDNKVRETAYPQSSHWWTHWSVRCDADGYTHATLIDMPLVWSFDETGYEVVLSEVVEWLSKESSIPTEPLLSLWAGSDKPCDKWFASDHEYWDRYINFEVHLRPYTSQDRIFPVEWYNVEVFGTPSQRRVRFSWLLRFGGHITSPVVWYMFHLRPSLRMEIAFTDSVWMVPPGIVDSVYRRNLDDVALFSRRLSRRAFQAYLRLLTVRRSRGQIKRSVSQGISDKLDIVGSYDVIQKTSVDPVSTILALRRSSKVDWNSYARVEFLFFG